MLKNDGTEEITKRWTINEARKGTPSVSFLTAAFLGLDRDGHLSDAGLPCLVHDLDDKAMLDSLVGIDEDQQTRRLGQPGFQNFANLGARHVLLVDGNCAVGRDGYAALSLGVCWPVAAFGKLTGRPL